MPSFLFPLRIANQTQAMAQQHGMIQLTGQIGGISFYKTEADGYLARTKTAHSKERIMHDKRFMRVKENSAEFGRASNAGKVLRRAIRHLTAGVADTRMYARMTGSMVHVLRGDAVHKRGRRTVADGDLTRLKGFQINKHHAFADVFRAHAEWSIDEAANTVTFRTNGLTPARVLAAPVGATHAQLVVACAAVDFNTKEIEVKETHSAYMDLREATAHDVELIQQIPARNATVTMLIGIRFFQQVNGQMYAMKEGNAMQITEVLGATAQPATTKTGNHPGKICMTHTSTTINRKWNYNAAALPPDKPG